MQPKKIVIGVIIVVVIICISLLINKAVVNHKEMQKLITAEEQRQAEIKAQFPMLGERFFEQETNAIQTTEHLFNDTLYHFGNWTMFYNGEQLQQHVYERPSPSCGRGFTGCAGGSGTYIEEGEVLYWIHSETVQLGRRIFFGPFEK